MKKVTCHVTVLLVAVEVDEAVVAAVVVSFGLLFYQMTQASL